MMRRALRLLFLLTWLTAAALPAAPSLAAGPAFQAQATPTPTPPAKATPRPIDVKPIMDRMSVADKVGQLFLVTFQGRDVSANSDIAVLVRDYRVGGVVLLPSNDNFRNTPILAVPVTATQTITQATPTRPAPPTLTAAPPTASATGQPTSPAQTTTPTQTLFLDTPQQIAALANSLQTLAGSQPRPISSGTAITRSIQPTVTAPGLRIPLLVGLDWIGDDSSFFAGGGGFTPLPSEMALGATWSPALADKVGQVVGQELQASGVNLLLGPTLDVLDVPRPGSKGDLDTRSFGGDPFWVGQMGQAFIRGVQTGSKSAVVTAAKHFPGQGGSDRRPEDEVATIQKSLQQLRQIELAPFASVTAGGDLAAPGVTGALMTSHIRYRGFQGNIRQLTPPISLAPQLQDLMALKEFADWRALGGVLISDALGVPALRRYYDPQLWKFPHRQVAQDAFLAGNDLLYLSRFALTDNWSEQFAAIKETVLYFQSKYQTDNQFRSQVDASVERILKLKLRIYGGIWLEADFQRDLSRLHETVGQNSPVTQAVARAALTLIYPGREELADRMPAAPLTDENILIFTEARTVRECAACAATPVISPTAVQEIMLRLYGPSATGVITPGRIRSFTHSDLNRVLAAPPDQGGEVERAIANARWIVFVQLDYSPDEYPESAALRAFLAKRSDSLRDKRLVVMALNAPYYLDTTEISKLTAYFGVYGRTAPFLETAVRVLFREFSPVGAPPVTVTGINYELIKILEPAAGQIIALGPGGSGPDSATLKASIQVGSRIPLETGVILDRKGHPVPDGTVVEFHLHYPGEALELAPRIETTSAGRARTSVLLDRPGELWITAQSGEAKDSARIVLKVGGDTPGSIATVLPSPTPSPTITPSPAPTMTPSPEPSPTPTRAPTPTPAPAPPKSRVALPSFFYGLLGVVMASSAAFTVRRRNRPPDLARSPGAGPSHKSSLHQDVEAALWSVVIAWGAYLLYSVGWLPGSTELQAGGQTWAAGAVTLIGGLTTLIWTGPREGQQDTGG